MRLALFSDIHGNLPALEAVLARLEGAAIDHFVCLGDVAMFGPQPRPVLARLQQLGCPIVMGNTDDLSREPPVIDDPDRAWFRELDLWGGEQVDEAERAFLAALAPTVTLALPAGHQLVAYHGSPRNYNDIIVYGTDDATLDEWFAGHEATLWAGGHTHQPFVRAYGDGLVLNPGSVGLPWRRDRSTGEIYNPARAEYALVTIEAGRLQVSLEHVSYELAELVAAVQASGMPRAERWLAHWRAG